MKRFILLFFIGSISIQSYAQDISESVITAFSQSYTAETSKEYDKAIGYVKAVYNENVYEINLRLGWLYFSKKDYTQASNYYKQAMKVRPSSIEAMLGFVNAAAALQKWEEVFSVYQKILVLDPNNSLVNYRIALMYYYRKDYVSADKHLQRVVERYPFDYDSLLLMAQVKLAGGKLTESKNYYQRALLYNPSNDEIKKVLNKL